MRFVIGIGSDGVIGFRHAGQNTTGVSPACSSIDAPPKPGGARSTDPNQKSGMTHIRPGPSPHFPTLLFYRLDESRGQVTFLTEFALESDPYRQRVSQPEQISQ
jgi:hypothetical protein